ncbi:hypothetical protein VTN77DRAFT_3318 [Rasamsonia byssochlamydoides]|uniref:uncharacterized protein n=1 Tax=Rasamsonia byssochlamydoides TaxID=89139 RepID=UPI003743F82C
MLSLPLIAPRDSHELWFGSSQPYRSSPSAASPYPSHTHPSSSESSRRQANHCPPTRAFISSATPSDCLAALLLEERALRVRKQNIACFGYSWIKPAGCPKTMLGMREEEAEREEGLAAAAAEMNAAAAAAAGVGLDAFGDTTQGQLGLVGDGLDGDELERDLDDDIPDADAEGLVEEGEEGFEEDDEDVDDDLMERNLDDDIPDAFPDDDDDDEDDDVEDDDGFDDQPDLDDQIPTAEGEEGFGDYMARDLDEDVPDAAEEGSQQEEEWQHTDTEAEDDDDDDGHDPFAEHFRTRTPGIRTPGTGSRGLPPPPLQLPSITRETEAQRRFLQRWSGNNSDVFDTSGISLDDDDLRASIASQESIPTRPSRFGRRFPRRGGPRDSLD